MSDFLTTDAIDRLREVATGHPYPLIFATVSGAHLYGFPSPDSDYDLRGCHVLPVREVVGLDAGRETIEASTKDGNFELDLVTHDAKKFFGLLLRKNGYVLEQVYSPLGRPHDTRAPGVEADRSGLHHEAPQPPLLRFRRDTVEAVREESGQGVSSHCSTSTGCC